MIVPRMKLDGAIPLDSHRRGAAIDGQMGYSPRPRSTSEPPANVDGVLPSHHGPSNAVMPVDDGFIRRSVSMPLAGIVGGAVDEDGEVHAPIAGPLLEVWGVRGDVLRRQTRGVNSTVPVRLQVGDCRVNGRQMTDPRQFNRPTPKVTSVAVSHCGSSVAYGDHGGRFYVLGALPATDLQRKAGTVGGIYHVQGDANRQGEGSPFDVQMSGDRQRRFKALCGATAYSTVIDPLNSVPVTPAISSLAFVPRDGPSNLIITANEKVPKLFKVCDNYDTPQASFRAVDLMGTKMIGPLVSTSRTHTHSVKQVHRYGMDHEYNVNAVSPTMDGCYFYTSDELSVRLWSVEHADTSIEVVTLPKPSDDDGGGDESAKETIMKTRIFAHEPALCFLSTSAGNVRVCDTRESLRWTNRLSHQVFTNPMRDMYDGKYSSVTNAITGGCALSPCGRYIAARDFFSVIMWDVRKAQTNPNQGGSYQNSLQIDESIVRRWELHPRMRHHVDALYQSNLLFERFGVDFCTSVSNAQTGCIVTGGLGGAVYAIDPLSTADYADEPYPDDEVSVLRAAEASMKGVKAFILPDPVEIVAEQRHLDEEDPSGSPASASRQDPYFHSLPSKPLQSLTYEQLKQDRALPESEDRRVSHILDSGIDGGGIWIASGEFFMQLIV